MTNPDFKDLLSAFSDAEVRYLVVGGYAVTIHPRRKMRRTREDRIANDRSVGRPQDLLDAEELERGARDEGS